MPEKLNIYAKLKVLKILTELFDFDFAIRFGNNQPILRITNKLYEKLGKPFCYWELPITQEQYDLLSNCFYEIEIQNCLKETNRKGRLKLL